MFNQLVWSVLSQEEISVSPLLLINMDQLVDYPHSETWVTYDGCRQEVVQLDNEIVFNEAIIEEREQGIQEIQQQINEVHEIFEDLAVLVREQGVVIGKDPSHEFSGI